MAQTPPPSGIKPLIKPVINPAGNPANKNFFSGSAIPIAPKVASTVNMVRPPLPVAAPVAAPSMGRPMTVPSPDILKRANNLRVNPNNPQAASSFPYVAPAVKAPNWGDNLVTGSLRYLMDPAIDFTLGAFPFTAPLSVPLSAAAASAGEKWAQDYEEKRGIRTEDPPKDAAEVLLAGGFGMLPLALGTGTRLARSLNNAQAPVVETFEAGTRAALRESNIQRFIEWFNRKTQRDIIDAAATAPEKMGPLYSKAFAGVEMATTHPSVYEGEMYSTFSDAQLSKLRTAIAQNADPEDIQFLKDVMEGSPTDVMPYNSGLVRAVRERFGPEQAADFDTIIKRIAQDQKYPLSFNTNERSAINALEQGKFSNVFGTKDLHRFNDSPNFLPHNIADLQQRRLEHEMLVGNTNLYPPGYNLDAAIANPENHPFYGYLQKPEAGVEGLMARENARPFGPITFEFQDELKNVSTTGTGDSVWRQNNLPFGNFDPEDIAASMNPHNIRPYTYARVGQDPTNWDRRSFARSWAEAQMPSGLSTGYANKATVRLLPSQENISENLKYAFDRYNMPYEVIRYPYTIY